MSADIFLIRYRMLQTNDEVKNNHEDYPHTFLEELPTTHNNQRVASLLLVIQLSMVI